MKTLKLEIILKDDEAIEIGYNSSEFSFTEIIGLLELTKIALSQGIKKQKIKK